MFRYLLFALVIALVMPREAHAQDDADDTLRWDDRWTRVHPVEYANAGLLLGGVIASSLTLEQNVDATEGGVMWDDPIRRKLVLGNKKHRDTAVIVGDVFYYGLFFYPNVVDLGIVTLAVHQSTDVAWQMFIINTQAYALTGLVSTLTQRLVGRSRPFAPECATDPDYDIECDDPVNRSQGFISGHAAIAFTGAALMCSHHAHLPLYGGGAGDVLACTTGLLGATISGMSRVVADRHYASDVIAAAFVGISSGYLLPELIHYHFSLPTFGGSIVPAATGSDFGLTLIGTL